VTPHYLKTPLKNWLKHKSEKLGLGMSPKKKPAKPGDQFSQEPMQRLGVNQHESDSKIQRTA
jgi:hypothetical protein